MREPAVLISDEPMQSLLPYGRLIDERTVLLHDATALSPNQVPKQFAFGRMWRFRQLNIDSMSWPEVYEVLNALFPFISDLPQNAVLAVRMTIRPREEDEKWLSARPKEHADLHRFHIESGQAHHIDGRPSRSVYIESFVELRVPVNLTYSRRLRGDYSAIHELVESQHTEEIQFFNERCQLLEEQLGRMNLHPSVLTGPNLILQLARGLNPMAEAAPLVNPNETLAEAICAQPAAFSPSGYEMDGWKASVFSLLKPPAKSFPGMLSASRLPRDRSVGLNLWELALDRPVTLVTQLAVANQVRLSAHVNMQNWLGGIFKKNSSGQGSSAIKVVTDSLTQFSEQLASGEEIGVRMSTHLTFWTPDGHSEVGLNRLRYVAQRVGLEFLHETLEGNAIFLKSLPLGNSMTCPREDDLRRMRTFPARDAFNLMPLLGGFSGFGNRTPGIRLINDRGEVVHYHLIRDNNRPHWICVASNRSGKSAFANWLAYCLLPQGATFIFFDRHGSYRVLCDVLGGRHKRFDRENPVCLGPFHGDLGPDHQSFLITVMGEMGTLVNAAVPAASTTLSNVQALVLGQQLKNWSAHGDYNSIPRLGQFVDWLKAQEIDSRICRELSIILSPFCNDGPYADFFDGPCEFEIEPGLLSMDVQPLGKSQLASVVTATVMGRIDQFVTNPDHLEVDKFVVMDEVASDLKSPQAAELIEAMLRAYARYNCSLGLISQNMSDFESDIGKIAQGQAGAFIAFAMTADEADLFTNKFTPEAPYIADVIKKLKPHDDCSQGFMFLPGGHDGGSFRVVADPEFMKKIGQSRYHRQQRGEFLDNAEN